MPFAEDKQKQYAKPQKAFIAHSNCDERTAKELRK